ncbi:hypothetical protein B0H17DRAFT_1151726 [Mycena rosella]|uniref:Uncharacterized protein n=1 Tax=Mycena rosella TaxID=1033263 RepID=A0AAD7BIG2_MYCRO|nr:hypothetical protein B0H17DRAFT_1151726 [Mycena rosella]
MERNYVEQDLVNLNRTQLVALVERQITKWSLPRGRLSKENMPSLRAILLNPTNGFTTTIINTNTTMGSTAGNIRSDLDLQTAGISSTNPAPVPNIPDVNRLQLLTQELVRTKPSRRSCVDLDTDAISIITVQLLVDDRRPIFNRTNTSQRVEVKIIDYHIS